MHALTAPPCSSSKVDKFHTSGKKWICASKILKKYTKYDPSPRSNPGQAQLIFSIPPPFPKRNLGGIELDHPTQTKTMVGRESGGGRGRSPFSPPAPQTDFASLLGWEVHYRTEFPGAIELVLPRLGS